MDVHKGATTKSGYPTEDITLHELRNAFLEVTLRGIISGKKTVRRYSSSPYQYESICLRMLVLRSCRTTGRKTARCLERQVGSPETDFRLLAKSQFS
jgi:hypothetical protein